MPKEPEIGDEIIVFPWMKQQHAGVNASTIEVGDEIAIHPSQEYGHLTHGTTLIEVGDDVIVRPGLDHPYIAIRPWGGCYQTTMIEKRLEFPCHSIPGWGFTFYAFEMPPNRTFNAYGPTSVTFRVTTTNPVYKPQGGYVWYPWGGMRFFVKVNLEDEWVATDWQTLYAYIECQENVTEYTLPLWFWNKGVPPGYEACRYIGVSLYNSLFPDLSCTETYITKLVVCP